MTETSTDLPTTIEFEHPFFQTLTHVHFRMSEPTDGSPVLVANLGDQEFMLGLSGIAHEFKIARDSKDGVMLDLVARGLQFITALWPGDPVPVEVLSGEASWDPEQQHIDRAAQRIGLQLVTWHAGEERVVVDAQPLAEEYESRDVANGREAAVAALAQAQDGDAAIADRLERLEHELAYIEALRDKFLQICRVKAVIDAIRKLHAKEMSLTVEIDSTMRLFKIALEQLGGTLTDVDERFGSIQDVLAEFEESETFVRDARNDLYCRMSAWGETIQFWNNIDPRHTEFFNLMERLRELNRFLAPRYMPVDEWILMYTEDTDEAELKYGGVMTW